MVSSGLREEDVQRLVAILREAERVCVQDLRNALVGYRDVDVGRMIWEACEEMRRDYGVVYIPDSTASGYIVRAKPIQVANRGARFRTVAGRKSGRAVELLRLAALNMTDAKDRERLERMAEREAERQNFRKRRAR